MRIVIIDEKSGDMEPSDLVIYVINNKLCIPEDVIINGTKTWQYKQITEDEMFRQIKNIIYESTINKKEQ